MWAWVERAALSWEEINFKRLTLQVNKVIPFILITVLIIASIKLWFKTLFTPFVNIYISLLELQYAMMLYSSGLQWSVFSFCILFAGKISLFYNDLLYDTISMNYMLNNKKRFVIKMETATISTIILSSIICITL